MKSSACLCVILAVASGPVAAAAPSAVCEAKRARIQTQITEATANNRKQELKGLQRALKANQSHCTDESLARARDVDISKARRELQTRERDLKDAERKGDVEKVARRKTKLEEAQRDLTEAERPLLP